VDLIHCPVERFVLQRINPHVFPRPDLIMANLKVLTAHINRQGSELIGSPSRRWELPQVRSTQAGQTHWIDAQGGFWRAISFIEGAQSFDILQDLHHGKEVGYALGLFHALLSDLPSEQLADTLPGFHITPSYLDQYHQILATARARGKTPSPEVKYCLNFVADRTQMVPMLETAKAEGKLCLRPIHGDPKINNVMIDDHTQQAVGMVDLDTVKPGLVHYDLGDCLRSGCNPAGEEAEQWETVYFDLDSCQSILSGYIPVAQTFLTEQDYAYLYSCIRLIAFELGLRFFTDYLAGDVYFKAQHPEHNLLRALVQFKLTESIEAQEAQISRLIQSLC